MKFAKWIVLGLIVIVIGFMSVYQVDSGEEAVVLRYGKKIAVIRDQGLNMKIPFIDQVFKENTDQLRTLEFGFRSDKGAYEDPDSMEDIQHESIMLTKDENLIDLEAVIQYKITSVEDWLFNIKDPDKTLKVSGESTIRRVVANHNMDESLTDNKSVIQQEIMDDLQKLTKNYGLGVQITQVQLQDVDPPEAVNEAFKNVQNAKETKQSRINEAQGQANDILPKARGKAASSINDAEGYKEKRIKEAEGDVANFNEIYKTYKDSKEVTRKRLYFEMVQEVFPNIEKFIVSEDGGTVKFLPLTGNMTQNPATIPTPAPATENTESKQ